MRKSREAKDGGDPDYFKRRFRAALGAPLRETGLNAEVFIWDDFHDRYLISNIIGISLQNGFDTTTNPNSVTRWGRLGRDDRDGVRREFNRAGTQHKLATGSGWHDRTSRPLPNGRDWHATCSMDGPR